MILPDVSTIDGCPPEANEKWAARGEIFGLPIFLSGLKMFTIRVNTQRGELLSRNNKPWDLLKQRLTSEFSFTEWVDRIPITVDLFQGGSNFAPGLSRLIRRFIIKEGYECELIEDFDYDERSSLDRFDMALRVAKDHGYTARDYQKEACLKMLKTPLSLLSLPTGTGKSFIVALMLMIENKKTLLVVDNKTLKSQLANDIKNITGKQCGVIGDGDFIPSKWTVAIIDSLATSKGIELVQSVENIYLDECHHGSANSYKNLMVVGIKNLKVRRGYSATTYRNDPKLLLLPAITGPIVYHKSTIEMIDAGYLSIPTIYMPVINEPKCMVKWYRTIYAKCIVNNQKRNEMGVEFLCDAIKRKELAVAFFKDVRKHPQHIKELLKRFGVRDSDYAMITGDVPGHKRDEILAKFKDGNLKLLLLSIGTGGEGTDLAANSVCGVNFSAGASEIQARQVLGRMLRKPRDSKTGDVDRDKPFRIKYIDFFDRTHPIMLKHSATRYNIYKAEGLKVHYIQGDE